RPYPLVCCFEHSHEVTNGRKVIIWTIVELSLVRCACSQDAGGVRRVGTTRRSGPPDATCEHDDSNALSCRLRRRRRRCLGRFRRLAGQRIRRLLCRGWEQQSVVAPLVGDVVERISKLPNDSLPSFLEFRQVAFGPAHGPVRPKRLRGYLMRRARMGPADGLQDCVVVLHVTTRCGQRVAGTTCTESDAASHPWVSFL